MTLETCICVLVLLAAFPLFTILLRLAYILPCVRLPKTIGDTKSLGNIHGAARLSIFLGSGGHTGEMMKMVSKLNLANLQRTWIYSGRDTASLNQAKSVEQHVYKNDAPVYIRIPRARRVGQSYISSVFTTVYSFVISFIILLFHKPDVLLLNGPGTCIPIAYILFLYKFLGLNTTKIVYIESLARVNKLSLSGRLIMPIADRFIVQWDQLYEKYNRAEYYGILI